MIEQTKTYPAVFFRQRPKAPVLCSLVVTTADIADWASVPTKTDKDPRKFQRPEVQSHVEEISQFFNKFEENSSPSSIVIGVSDKDRIKGTTKNNEPVDFSAIVPGSAVQGFLIVKYFEAVFTSLGEVQLQAKELIEKELARITEQEERLRAAVAFVVATDEGDAEDQGDELGEDGSPDDAEELRQIEDYKKSLLSYDVDTADLPTLTSFCSALLDLHKPGLIIDGQHRVKGTRRMNVHFPVTLLPEADWPELAFQFIVLNKSSKKVADSLLINIVGNSLTDNELQTIDARLSESGIPVPLYQGVMRLHDDDTSPFYSMLRFGLGTESGVIDASAAKKKIVNFWYSCKTWKRQDGGIDVQTGLYPLLAHLIPGKTKAEKLDNWHSGIWYDYLKVFWDTGKAYYTNNSSLWSPDLLPDNRTPVSPLLRATIIGYIQQAFIEHMHRELKASIDNDPSQSKSMSSELPNAEKFGQYCALYFKRLAPEFFSDWGEGAKGLDGGKGPKIAFLEAVAAVISNRTTIPQLKGKMNQQPHLLFKK
jgi:hypothetical protein